MSESGRLESGSFISGAGSSSSNGKTVVGSLHSGPVGVSESGSNRIESSVVYRSRGLTANYDADSVVVVAVAARTIKVAVAGATGSVNGQVRYREGGKTAYQSLALNPADADTLAATLPATLFTTRGLEYYLEIEDDAGTVMVGSADAPLAFVSTLTNVAAPALPDAQYRMIGFPFDVSPATPAAVFEDDLGSYVPEQWRLGRFDPATGSYQEYPSVGTITRGRGYWLIARGNKTVDASGQSARPDTTVASLRYASLVIRPGWNQIAAPFAFDVLWSARVAESGIEPALWAYTSGSDAITSYTQATRLVPFSGYWVRNSATGPRHLLLPYLEAGLSQQNQKVVDGYPSEWSLTLSAISGHAGDVANFAGTRAGANDGRDEFDLSEPPPFDRYVSLAFLREAGDGKAEYLAGDFRSPNDDGWRFPLAVRANTNTGVRLALTDVVNVPGDWRVMLIDESMGTSRDLLAEREVHLPHTVDTNGTRLSLVVGPEAYVSEQVTGLSPLPRAFALLQNYPNPFNGSTMIRFESPTVAHVELAVYNVLGQRIATLLDGELEAGMHEYEWDAATEQGRELPTGIYFLRLSSGTFRQSRRLVLLK